MAQFLKCPDNVLAANIVPSQVYIYILPELRPFLHFFGRNDPAKLVDDDGEEVIQKLLDESTNKLRMYGSAKELAGNIKIFRNFPESFVLFEDQQCPFNTSPVIYNSLNGEKYLCKPDLYTIIQNIAIHAITHNKIVFFHLLLAKVLKSKIAETDGPVEFVKFDQKMFDEIEKEMKEGEAKSLQQASAQRNNLEKSLRTKNYAAIVSKLRELNPKIWSGVEAYSLLTKLQLMSGTEIAESKEFIFVMLTNTCIVNCIEQIMGKRASLFMSTPKSSPITVRLFEDGEERYVMEAELNHALNRVSTGSERFEIQSDGLVYKGMHFKEVKAKYGDQIQTIEFIRTPILRSKHCAVPIRSHFPGQFVIPAVDYCFEFWRNVILGIKLFQKYQCSNWDEFAPTFHNVEAFLYTERKQQYFLRAGILLDSVVSNSLQQYEVSPVKDVRNAKKDGFTAQNLKNELKYLGLTNTFPEILDYSEDVYAEIDKVKKDRYLRTCDLFDAVERCQLICVLNRAPNLRKFVHNQKGCNRVLGYKCELCEKEEKTSDALEISQKPAKVQKTSDIQDSIKNMKIENTNESRSKQYSQPALSAPKEKCSKSSAVLVETQNELKEVEKKMMNTEKELSDLKKQYDILVQSEAQKTEELAKMKEELSKEKEKNQEKEEEILKASKENEELQKTILKLTAENEVNERVIQKLLDRITNSSTNQQKTTEIDLKNIEKSTPTATVTSKNAPLVIDCLICSSQIESGQEVIRCPPCKRRFHSNCAFKWRKDHTQCPACNGDLPGI
ncbi:hypothetical protein GCK72_010976 [Caenorhabditis remanei]|uniref:RING-type domain-containing protein n=1 Tax=Caenorhabditis remanei TaxID=31234 RepID=A0A6A5H7E8_CAERE|nr:hypothetical protein GCK72_010976 [Caenorhabditis remanei]KAF1762714.1 hypothetical protein GCK72_010976 [Caenorhabditis remanei]